MLRCSSSQLLAVRETRVKERSHLEEYPCFYMRRGARGAVMTPRSLSLSRHGRVFRPVARDSTLPPCGVLHHTVAPSPRFPLPRSLSHAGTSISSPPLILSQPLSLTPCRCPASIRANPPPRLALFLRASLRCLSVNPSNVSRSSEKRSLVSCAIPHSPLPTFDFFPRGRSSDASQIHQPVGFIQ